MAFHIKLDQYLLVFALRAEIDLIAVGIFSTGKIEAVATLENLSNIQIVRPRDGYLKTDNSMPRAQYEFGALAKARCFEEVNIR